MRITSKGQVTIPQEIREKMGFLPDTEVEFVIEGSVVKIVKSDREGQRSRRVVDALRGRATSGRSTDDILKLTRR